MKIESVEITDQNTTQLRVVWHKWRPYAISKPAVQSCADELRRILAELVKHALAKDKDIAEAAPILKKLAKQGQQLYHVLFINKGGEEDPKSVKEELEALQRPFQIDFSVDDSVFVPWGLIYEGDWRDLPDTWDGIPESERWEKYCKFWCFAHDVTVRHVDVRPNRVRNASPSGMLRAIHPAVFDKAKELVPKGAEQSFIRWLEERYHTKIDSDAALESALEAEATGTGLLYFYCHASPSRLAIGTEEAITATRLLDLLDQQERPSGSGCLLLINGCRTATGDSHGSFLLSSSAKGFVGFIGAETDVPDVFALRFSSALVHRLIAGETLGQAMHRLYRDHFPLSLVYGAYAHPAFRVVLESGAPPFQPNGNFSTGVIGTSTLEARHGT